MAQIVNLGTLDSGDSKITVDGGADISDQKRLAGFGNKQRSLFGFGADFFSGYQLQFLRSPS